jgi:hypothetical protein
LFNRVTVIEKVAVLASYFLVTIVSKLSLHEIGFVLFSLSYIVDVGGGSYPPYAVNSFALYPISVFMVVFGIYGSAQVDADITQVLSYCIRYRIRSGLLLYPKLTSQIHNEYPIRINDKETKVIFAESIDISIQDRVELTSSLKSFVANILKPLFVEDRLVQKS